MFEAIKEIQPKKLFRISIQTLVKANLNKNFDLNTENQSTGPIGFIRSIGAIGFTSSTKNTNTNGFIKNIKPIEIFSVWKKSRNTY